MSISKITVANYITQQIALSGRTQTEICLEIGYENTNVITMIKQGKTKLPVTKVKLIAKALGVDPVHLLRLVMTEYMPETFAVIQDTMGGILVTESESAVLSVVRDADNGQPVFPKTGAEKAELRELVGKWIKRIEEEYESNLCIKTL